MNPALKKALRILTVSAFWLGLWGVLALAVGKPLLLPTPWAVLKRLGELLLTTEFYLATFRSLSNVLLGIFAALLLGILFAILSHRLPFFRSLLLPLMTVIKATPIVSFIILAILWLGARTVPSFITVLIVLPVVWSNLDMGLSRVDPQLKEMVRVFGLSRMQRIRRLTVPSVMPYFLSACRTSIGLAWKAGIAAEVIALPLRTIGVKLSESKQYMESVDLFAWTLVVILLSLVFEVLLSNLLTKIPGGTVLKEVN